MPSARPPDVLHIRKAGTPEDFHSFKRLALQYYDWLNEELDFQGIEQELDSLPGCYAAPSGCMLIASLTGCELGSSPKDIGVVALRPLVHQERAEDDNLEPSSDNSAESRTCEMKRLFVLPQYWGYGAGKALAQEAVLRAKHLGYSAVVLDTLERLTSANVLYTSLGFQKIRPYYSNPLENVVYWQKDL